MKLLSVVLLVLAPVLTSCTKIVRPVDCSDIYQQDKTRPSGVYTIYPIGSTSAVQVYCDMQSEGGQWTTSSLVSWFMSSMFLSEWIQTHEAYLSSAAGVQSELLSSCRCHVVVTWLHSRRRLTVQFEDLRRSLMKARCLSYAQEVDCLPSLPGVTAMQASSRLKEHHANRNIHRNRSSL
ncbi:Microfibril-associated glycoprotein 4 [Larimichthys crocea]|uniref:Uncharacterized protein n=1 Tax=Larimichthys crocea TaxID=215358 RepID=A0ACD3R575_LARCR|nr:Microfibril-associated glycoprotein 4 [Larimichthys crocea]